MNNQEAAFKAVVDKLTAAMVSGQPLDYVKYLQQGNHREILTDQLPAIIVHPRRVAEEWHAMSKQKKATLEIEIRGIVKVANRAAPVVTTADGPGILRMDGDIKNVLEEDLSEGSTTLRPDITTEAIRSVGEYCLETVISVRLFLNLFIAGARGT